MSSSPISPAPSGPPNQKAFISFYNWFRPKAVAYATKALGCDKYLAEDAVQEVVLKAWKVYRGGYTELRSNGYHFGMLKNVCITILRKRYRRSMTLDFHSPLLDDFQGNSTLNPLAAAADQGPPPEQEMVNQEKVALVRRIIGSLSPDERDVLTSYYIEGESQAEIAARLGQTINAVKSKLNRIRIKLREQFSEEIAPFLQFL